MIDELFPSWHELHDIPSFGGVAVTVADALAHPLFARARLVAGAAGVERAVSWVHVAEIPHPRAFLRRGAMVLTTGVGLSTPQARAAYVREAVEAGASAVVLEAGPYSPGVPEEFRAVCEAAGVPLIVFDEETRFLDITQALNGALLHGQYAVLERLLLLQERVGAVLSQAEGVDRLLEVAAATLGASVAFLPRLEGEGVGHGPRARELSAMSASSRVLSRPTPVALPFPHLRQSVVVLGQAEGDVALVREAAAEADDLATLALGLLARSVGQEILRRHALAEDQRRQEAAVVSGILGGDEAALRSARRLMALRRGAERGPLVAVAAAADPEGVGRLYTQVRAGLQPLLAAVHGGQVLFVLAQDGETDLDRRLREFAQGSDLRLGVADPRDDADDLAAAFEEAMAALGCVRPPATERVRRYADLGAHRLLAAHAPSDLWRRLVLPELGGLLAPDRERDGALLATLRALVESDWDRSRAARRLGLSRQALYARLGRLGRALGHGWDRYPRTLDLALALAAYDAAGERGPYGERPAGRDGRRRASRR
jgi:purine catabolism regulator